MRQGQEASIVHYCEVQTLRPQPLRLQTLKPYTVGTVGPSPKRVGLQTLSPEPFGLLQTLTPKFSSLIVTGRNPQIPRSPAGGGAGARGHGEQVSPLSLGYSVRV